MTSTPRARLGAAVCAVVSFAAAGLARAQDGENLGWEAGGGGAVFTSPYKGADDVVTPLPYLSYVGERFSLTPYGVFYELGELGPLSVAATAAPRLQLTDEDDSPALEGMKRRKSTLDAGLAATLASSLGVLRLSAVADTLGKHDGVQVSATYGFGLQLGKLELAPSAGLAWQSGKLADYYYGVRADEARAGRPAYEVGDAWVPSVSLMASYRLSERVRFLGVTSAEFLPKTIRQSPVVGDRMTAQAIAGLAYKF